MGDFADKIIQTLKGHHHHHQKVYDFYLFHYQVKYTGFPNSEKKKCVTTSNLST